ncbi:carbonic anhydrase [Nitrosomonas marina]|uniref:carbonic anhydrase n=1 Tax=Nitrosomonas marina TaxID=917 RepID=A0A1H8BSY6_9PROT|nr:carbonic anhydrase family protein [Nitrosomonas marina]SEM85886.1 carbonic anhydrase [Nitrosomonas marina]
MINNRNFSGMFASAAFIFVINSSSSAEELHWSHEEQAMWGSIEDTSHTEVPHIYPFAECAIGNRQSPIDLAEAEIEQTTELNRLRIWYDTDMPVFYNSGHGIQVNTSLDYTGYLEVGNETYPLIQFHFHEPSEHVVGDKQFPAELHYVHVREDGRLVVMAVAIEEGEPNETFQTILDNIPQTAGEMREGTGIAINPETLLPPNFHKPDFYTFAGSLTTPPCSEGVQWYLLARAITISAAQLEQLRGFYTNNARFPQDLNGRTLLTTQ